MSESRAAIVYCPYCGDEDLHPAERPAGPPDQRRPESSAPGSGTAGWECRSCLRVFRVNLLGLAPRPSTVPTPSHKSQER